MLNRENDILTEAMLKSIGYTGDICDLHNIHLWIINEHNLYACIYPLKNQWEGDVRCCDMTKDVHASIPSFNECKFDSYDECLSNLLSDAIYYIYFNNIVGDFNLQ